MTSPEHSLSSKLSLTVPNVQNVPNGIKEEFCSESGEAFQPSNIPQNPFSLYAHSAIASVEGYGTNTDSSVLKSSKILFISQIKHNEFSQTKLAANAFGGGSDSDEDEVAYDMDTVHKTVAYIFEAKDWKGRFENLKAKAKSDKQLGFIINPACPEGKKFVKDLQNMEAKRKTDLHADPLTSQISSPPPVPLTPTEEHTDILLQSFLSGHDKLLSSSSPPLSSLHPGQKVYARYADKFWKLATVIDCEGRGCKDLDDLYKVRLKSITRMQCYAHPNMITSDSIS